MTKRPSKKDRSLTTARLRAYWFILLVVTYTLIELNCFFLLKLGARFHITYGPIPAHSLVEEDRRGVEAMLQGKNDYLAHSPTLGWTIRPSGVDASGLYRANSQGLRADRDYALEPATGKIRISAFGDSFTHGDEVANADTWEEQLARLDPRLEVLNFGVQGYGPDQAYLRYMRDGRRLKCQIVMLGFMSENINRVVNVFRAFYTPGVRSAVAKPRYVVQRGELVLLENPLPRVEDYQRLLTDPRAILPGLAEKDYWYHVLPHQSPADVFPSVRLFKTGRFWFERSMAPWSIIGFDGVYRPESEALSIVKAILKEFHDQVSAAGNVPVIVLFPSHRDIMRFQRHRRKRYEPLLDYLRARRIVFVDLLEGFAAAGAVVRNENILSHYTVREENRIVAETLHRFLDEAGLLTPR